MKIMRQKHIAIGIALAVSVWLPGCASMESHSEKATKQGAAVHRPTEIGRKVYLAHPPTPQEPYITYQVVKLFSNGSEMAAGGEQLAISAGEPSKTNFSCRVGKSGECSVHLIKHLHLTEFEDNSPIRIYCKLVNERLATELRPSQWLWRKFRIVDGSTYLFKAPGTESRTNKMVFRGQEVPILNVKKNWIEIQADTGVFWVPKRAGSVYWGQ